jgi:hypothetical protein
VAADVEHESAPREAGLVVYGDGIDDEALRRDVDELEKGLEAVEDAERIWRAQGCAGCRDFEMVGLIFVELLDCGAWAGCLDQERGETSRLHRHGKYSGLRAQVGEKAIAGSFEAGFGVTLEADSKSAI